MSNCCEQNSDKKQLHGAELPANPAEDKPVHHHDVQDTNGSCGSSSAPVQFENLVAAEKVGNHTKTAIRIMQMDCPTEESLIRKKLGSIPSVKSMEFNLMQRVLTVIHDADALAQVLDALRSLDFTPEVATGSAQDQPKINQTKKSWWPLALAVIAALTAETIDWLNQPEWLAAIFALVAVSLCGLTTYKKGWVAIKNGNLNINALMSIAVTGALILGHWSEAAMVMVLFTIAELIEAKSLDRARNAISGLMQLTPEQATVQQPDGRWLAIAAKTVEIGNLVRVKPGERIALDGDIVNGRSTINQAPITGESLPIEKAEGDQVFAGTINQSGSFEYRVTAAANNTTLARIIHAVEEAQGAKAPTQRFVDSFARIYTPIVFILALGIAVVPPLLFDAPWYNWLYKALVLLVIACPCALVISTPVTIVSGLAAAARRGILIKGGVYLEEGRKLKWLALDKTGTITHGKPVQTDFEFFTDGDSELNRTLAASLAGRSDHPVSQAVTNMASEDALPKLKVDDFEALLGRGVKGSIDGQTYYLGNHRLVEELGRCSKQLETRLDALERQGKSVVMLVGDDGVLSLFAVADTVKESSRAAISDLHKLGVKTIMLTGDNKHTAENIAKQVKIDQVRGNQLPEDKLQAIETFATQGTIGMVGDGINDAPALARADIGFAMGVMGTDTAIETADVALMDDDLGKIPQFIRLSKDTHAILLQNIVIALGIKLVFLLLTIMGSGTMWMAVFADVGASLLVVANGLRLLRK